MWQRRRVELGHKTDIIDRFIVYTGNMKPLLLYDLQLQWT